MFTIEIVITIKDLGSKIVKQPFFSGSHPWSFLQVNFLVFIIVSHVSLVANIGNDWWLEPSVVDILPVDILEPSMSSDVLHSLFLV